MKNKILCIGDIHGCHDEMVELVNKLPMDKEKDIVVFLGDYIDRGPDSKKVIEQIMEWAKQYPHWVFLIGNHEDMLFDALVGGNEKYEPGVWVSNGGDKTIKSFVGEVKKEDGVLQTKKFVDGVLPFLIFMKDRMKIYYETDDYFFVHGGLYSELSLEENKLNPTLMLWTRPEKNDDKNWGKKVIFGHTVFHNGPLVEEYRIGMDTGCNSGGTLTAIELPSEKFFAVKSKKKNK